MAVSEEDAIPTDEPEPPALVVGPVLRRGPADGRGWSVFVETSRACTIRVAVTATGSPETGAKPASDVSGTAAAAYHASTFEIEGHHYGFVDVTDQAPGFYTYTVELDELAVWPAADPAVPPSRVRVWNPGEDFLISGGSCRQHAPQNTEPHRRWLPPPDRGPIRREVVERIRRNRPAGSPVTASLGADALAALAAEILRGDRALPHLLLLTGDQVYADEQHPEIASTIRRRRLRGGDIAEDDPSERLTAEDARPPRETGSNGLAPHDDEVESLGSGSMPTASDDEVEDFDEFAWLYRDTWAHPLIRWILSSVPSLMIFDDHDVIDDWNISDTWIRDLESTHWWHDYIETALMAYWIYQHLGNHSTEERAELALLQAVSDDDEGGVVLRRFTRAVGTGHDERLAFSWSHVADWGPLRIVLLDSRNGRVVQPDGRSMLSDRDWDFLDDQLRNNVADRHLLVVTSVPWILPEGVHDLERWASALVADTDRPRRSRFGERLRRAIDLEHWAAFGDSFERLGSVLARSTRPPHSNPVVFSGDVHMAYVAEQPLPDGSCAVQVVSSPMRQGEPTYEQVGRRAAMTFGFASVMRRVCRWTRGLEATDIAFEITDGPWTVNNIASFRYSSSTAEVVLEQSRLDDDGLHLDALTRRTLTGPGDSPTELV